MSAWRTARRAAAGLGVLTLLAAAAACSEGSTFLGRDQVVVAHKGDQPGTSFWDGSKYSGFDAYVGAHVAKGLGVKYIPKLITSDVRENEITDGVAGMVIATYSITEDREDKVDFVGPYAVTNQGYMVLAGPGHPIRSEKALVGKNICTMTSTTAVENLEGRGLNKPVQVANASMCMKKLLDEEVDAFFMDEMILHGFKAANPGVDLRIFPGQAGEPQFYGIGMPKGHQKDCEDLKEIVKDYVRGGQWTTDFGASLPAFAKEHPDKVDEHRPSTGLIDKLSCKG